MANETTDTLLLQLLEASKQDATRLELVQTGVAAITNRLDVQDTAIKELTEALRGNGEKAGVQTQIALLTADMRRTEATVSKLQTSDQSQSDDLKEISTKFKIVTALLGLGGGGGGAAAVLVAQNVLGG